MQPQCKQRFIIRSRVNGQFTYHSRSSYDDTNELIFCLNDG